MPDQKLTSLFDSPAKRRAEAEAAKAVSQDPSGHVSGTDYARLLAASALRVGGPIVGATGGAALGSVVPGIGTAAGGMGGGALGGGIGEYLAEKVEPDVMNPHHDVNAARVGINAAVGAVPGAAIVRAGKPLLSAGLGAGLSYASTVGDKTLAQNEDITHAANPLTWNGSELAGTALGAIFGAGFSKMLPHSESTTPPPADPVKRLDQIAKQAGPDLNPTDKQPGKPPPADMRPRLIPKGEEPRFQGEVEPAGKGDKGQPLFRIVTDPTAPAVASAEQKARAEGVPKFSTKVKDIDAGIDQAADVAAAQRAVNDKGDKAFTKRIVTKEKAQAQAANLRSREEVSADKAQGASITDVEKAQTQATNMRAREEQQAAKAQQGSIDAGQKASDEQAALAAIEAAKEGKVPQESPVTERTSVKTGNNTSESLTTRYVEPPKDEDGEGGSAPTNQPPTTSGPAPTILPGPARTIFPSEREAIAARTSAGAIGEVRNPDGKGWIHVFRGGTEPTPAPTPVVDDFADIKAAAEAPIQTEAPPVSTKGAALAATDKAVDVLEKNTEELGMDPDRFKNYVQQNTGEPLPSDKPNGATPVPETPPNLVKSAPTDDINDVDLATGVAKVKETKPAKTPAAPTFRTYIQAQGAAKKAGLPTDAVEKIEGGFRVAQPEAKPTIETTYSKEGGIYPDTAQPSGAIGTYNEAPGRTGEGKWSYGEFTGKAQEPVDIKKQLEDSLAAQQPPKPPKKTGGEGEGGATPEGGGQPPSGPKPPKGRKKAAAAPLSDEQLAQLSDKERFAAYKKQAPSNDASFRQRHDIPVPEPLKTEWDQLVANAQSMPRAEVYKQLRSLQQRAWQLEANPNEPALGSPRWHEQQQTDALIGEKQDLQSGVDPNSPDSFSPMVKTIGDHLSEGGFITPEMAFKLLTTAGGATLGAASNPNDPLAGAIIGGGAGFATGALAPAIVRQLLPHAGEMSEEGRSELGKNILETVKKTARLLPDWQRFALLTHPVNLPLNAVVGPWGSAMMGALEHAVAGDERGKQALAMLLNPKNFPSEFREAYTSGEARGRIEQAESRAESSLSEAPEWFRRTTETPAAYMTAGDLAAKKILMDAGFSEEEARRITLTSEPYTPSGRGVSAFKKGAVTEGGKHSWLVNMMLPFYRTSMNQFEQGLERTPGVGILAQKMAKDLPDDARLVMAQQLVGTGASGAAFVAGMLAPSDQESQRFILKFINNAGGQYGVPMSAAFLAGQAAVQGGGSMDAMGKEYLRDMPLPTTRPIADLWNLAQTGTPPVSMVVPQILRPSVPLSLPWAVGNMIESQKQPQSQGSVLDRIFNQK
jgi:hypothetical protein